MPGPLTNYAKPIRRSRSPLGSGTDWFRFSLPPRAAKTSPPLESRSSIPHFMVSLESGASKTVEIGEFADSRRFQSRRTKHLQQFKIGARRFFTRCGKRLLSRSAQISLATAPFSAMVSTLFAEGVQLCCERITALGWPSSEAPWPQQH